ncbi:Nif3-like dinuclear metal center hexameric protein [Sunxiuqinia sp. A32]|uniref:Nif3-like dinuclear metal center hexameric protein n=1 Tax=Sunxiuqinia sp. A32 TaxID=3461496 RepID=UPI0040452119
MSKQITAKQVISRMQNQLADTWQGSPEDVFNAGDPNTFVTGIATSFTPSIEVLEKAIADGKNLIITQQPAYYLETEDYLKDDPAYIYKKNLIEANGLVLYRFYDNWNSMEVDGQLLGLAKALDWDQYHIYDSIDGGEEYNRKNKYFMLPETALRDKVIEIKEKLNIQGIRVEGDPGTKIRKAALSHGMFKISELQEFLSDPEVDLIVIAEAIEWESCEYFRDFLSWKGNDKAMILIGRDASEDPGYGEVASWLKSFIPEVSIDWIPAKEPFWVP